MGRCGKRNYDHSTLGLPGRNVSAVCRVRRNLLCDVGTTRTMRKVRVLPPPSKKEEEEGMRNGNPPATLRRLKPALAGVRRGIKIVLCVVVKISITGRGHIALLTDRYCTYPSQTNVGAHTTSVPEVPSCNSIASRWLARINSNEKEGG